MAFLSKSCDLFWNGLDTTIHTVIPERVRNILAKLQPGFNFTASKYVLIKDWRLGIILRALQVAILIYILADIFRAASYLESEVPKGVVLPFTPVADRRERKSQWTEQVQNSTELNYCTNPDEYAFEYEGQTFDSIRCMYAETSSLTTKGETQFFITTYTNVGKLVFIKAASEGDCDGPIKPSGFKFIIYAQDACVYESSVSYFPIGSDAGELSLIHGYFTSIVEKSGGNPETVVRNLDTDQENRFEEGEPVLLPISRWLEIAGVKLDEPMNSTSQNGFEPSNGQTGSGAFEDQYPRLRLSGVNLLINMNYYQRKLAPSPWKKSTGGNSDKVICIIDVEPVYRWTQQGSDVRHTITGPDSPIFLDVTGFGDSIADGEVGAIQTDFQNFGIQFTFQVAGNIGRFSFSALIAALVAGSVLLSVAQVVVTQIALFGMGLSSQLYMEFMRESVDWRKEYARFAAQALVAGYAFMGYDENNSFKLDRKEIFKTLKTILGQRLPEDKLAALADFVMRQGEEDTKVSKGAFRLEEGDFPASNLISIEEWISIFTEEKVSLTALERLIDNEYKDVRTRDFLVRMAQGVRMRGLPTGEVEEDGPVDEDDGADVDPEILEFQQSAKRQMTQAFLANMQRGKSEGSEDPDVEKGGKS